MNPVVLPSLQDLLLAIALGAIVGLENEYRMLHGVRIYLGLRTSVFIAMLGYLFALLYYITSNVAVLITAAGVIVIFASLLYEAKVKLVHYPGATTYVATMILFFVGLLSGLGYYQYATIIGVLLAALSFYKREMLSVIGRLTRAELLAAINLLVIAFVILPLLPNMYLGPYQFFNPFAFWLIVSAISLLFFLQYFIIKYSERGILFSTLIGSIISGTGIAFALINLGNKVRSKAKTITYNVLFSANLPMIFGQGLILIYFTTISAPIVYYFLPVLATSSIFLAILWLLGRKELTEKIEAPQKPFPIMQALEFAVLFFVILSVSRLVDAFVPQILPLTMFFSGIANVAGSTVSIGLLFLDGKIAASYAAFLLGLSIAAGVLGKAIVALVSKNRAIKRTVIAASVIFCIVTLAASTVSLTMV
jgi:uncharacterized membrane protein (DUF4010 family)